MPKTLLIVHRRGKAIIIHQFRNGVENATTVITAEIGDAPKRLKRRSSWFGGRKRLQLSCKHLKPDSLGLSTQVSKVMDEC